MPRLIVISAPSGAGKTTLCQHLLADFQEIELSISSTTRAPRGAEQNGKEYYFLTGGDFEAGIGENRFAEWARVHDHYYGTSRETIDRAFRRGHSVLLDIDVQGAASLRRAYPSETFSVFVRPPSLEVLEQRLRARATDSEETIQKRLANARAELAESVHFDRVLINDTFEHAYAQLRSWVNEAIRGAPGG